jgi:hypothetical protein
MGFADGDPAQFLSRFRHDLAAGKASDLMTLALSSASCSLGLVWPSSLGREPVTDGEQPDAEALFDSAPQTKRQGITRTDTKPRLFNSQDNVLAFGTVEDTTF